MLTAALIAILVGLAGKQPRLNGMGRTYGRARVRRIKRLARGM